MPSTARYRLYVDESGDHTYVNLEEPARRYLGLTGIAIENNYYRNELHGQFEALKQQHFPHNPDEPVILVRKKIIDRKGAFGVLKDPARCAAWEHDFVEFLRGARFELFTVVIDKKDHLGRYGGSARHPYNYCATLLLERYRGMLNARGARGDVLAESRGGAEDMILKAEYRSIWDRGTFYHSGGEFQSALTSRELKVQKKEMNVAGLQIADMVAAPSKHDVLLQNGRSLTAPPNALTQALIQVLLPKYNPYCRKLLA